MVDGRAYPEQSVSNGPPPAPSTTISNTGVLLPGSATSLDPTAFMVNKSFLAVLLNDYSSTSSKLKMWMYG
jgi:hypothetical protein